MFQKTISLGLLLLTPGFLAAQDSGAMLYGTGLVYLNGSQLANSSAVAIGDVIQIKGTGEANLNASGSSVMIQSSTIARFRSGGLALDRGSISVVTGNGMSVFARDFKITPATGGWTEFYVTRVTGSIQIIARKGNVTVSCGATTSTIKEGQEISRNDAPDCGVVAQGSGAPAAVKPPLLTSSTAKYAALGVGGGLLLWSLAHSDNPVSPSVP
jgi:hypothetical protein